MEDTELSNTLCLKMNEWTWPLLIKIKIYWFLYSWRNEVRPIETCIQISMGDSYD